MSASDTPISAPVLFCIDGSDGSLAAVGTAARLLAPRDAVVLSVWEPATRRLAEADGFGIGLAGYMTDQVEFDGLEEAAAVKAAEHAASVATEAGWNASARTEQAPEMVWKTIVEVADAVDAALIVCGARGRGMVKRAILGSVSEAVLHNAHRPTLISPEHGRA